MDIGSEYQLKDSYFVIVHPSAYIISGILILLGMAVFIIMKKIKI